MAMDQRKRLSLRKSMHANEPVGVTTGSLDFSRPIGGCKKIGGVGSRPGRSGRGRVEFPRAVENGASQKKLAAWGLIVVVLTIAPPTMRARGPRRPIANLSELEKCSQSSLRGAKKKPVAFPRCTIQVQVARRDEFQWAGAIVIGFFADETKMN